MVVSVPGLSFPTRWSIHILCLGEKQHVRADGSAQWSAAGPVTAASRETISSCCWVRPSGDAPGRSERKTQQSHRQSCYRRPCLLMGDFLWSLHGQGRSGCLSAFHLAFVKMRVSVWIYSYPNRDLIPKGLLPGVKPLFPDRPLARGPLLPSFLCHKILSWTSWVRLNVVESRREGQTGWVRKQGRRKSLLGLGGGQDPTDIKVIKRTVQVP